jgi:hypothetical protein
MQLLQFGDSRFVCLQQAEQIVGFELLHDGWSCRSGGYRNDARAIQTEHYGLGFPGSAATR